MMLQNSSFPHLLYSLLIRISFNLWKTFSAKLLSNLTKNNFIVIGCVKFFKLNTGYHFLTSEIESNHGCCTSIYE